MSYVFNLRVRKREGQYEVECFDTQDHGPHTPYAITRATDLQTALEMMVPYMREAVLPSGLGLGRAIERRVPNGTTG